MVPRSPCSRRPRRRGCCSRRSVDDPWYGSASSLPGACDGKLRFAAAPWSADLARFGLPPDRRPRIASLRIVRISCMPVATGSHRKGASMLRRGRDALSAQGAIGGGQMRLQGLQRPQQHPGSRRSEVAVRPIAPARSHPPDRTRPIALARSHRADGAPQQAHVGPPRGLIPRPRAGRRRRTGPQRSRTTGRRDSARAADLRRSPRTARSSTADRTACARRPRGRPCSGR